MMARKENYEDYVISNVEKNLATRPNDAKAWMITAKFLFPNSFNVQYEAYIIERNFKNTKPAAYYFEELTKKFPNEPGLLNEMQKITDALRTKTNTEESSFLKKLFKCMSNDMKYKILSIVSSKCKDPMEHCCLMLLLLQELPSQLFQHGEKVIDTLLTAEKLSHCKHPVNSYRKLLVCNAMPTILYSPNFKLSLKLLYSLLQAAVEFFVCFSFTSSEDIDSDILKSDRETLGIHSERVSNAWATLFMMMKKVGQQLHWSLVDLFASKVSYLLDMNWEKVLSAITTKLFDEAGDHGTLPVGGSFEGSGYEKEVFFCTAVIFFYSLNQFARLVSPLFASKSVSDGHHYILIEEVHMTNDDEMSEPFTKKFKYDREAKKGMSITVSKNATSELGDRLTQSFVMAVKVWELIHHNYALSTEFSHLCQITEMDKWTCFQEFFINMLVYQGCHKEAIEHLRHIHAMSTDEFIKNKASLQLASCFNYIQDYSKACNYLFDVICSFPNTVSSGTNTGNNTEFQCKALSQSSSNHLHFMMYDLEEVLHFCIELLISIYKKKILLSGKNGEVLGHLLVLLQYKWPMEEELFLQCVKHIQQNGSFCYGKFFDYIIVPGILEEFMFLTTPAGGSVTLDLLPTSTMQIGKQRAVTRGVNKGAKEDLRETMKKQMARCEENLDNLFVTFIKQERHCIQMII